MDQQEFIQRIGESLFEFNKDIDSATVLDRLDGWDSLGRLNIAVLLHESFCMIVDTKTLLKYQTVGDIIELVKDKLKV